MDPTPPTTRQGGRPKKADEDKRDYAVQVRMKGSGYERIKALAEQRGSSMADVIRELCNKGKVVVNTPTPEQEVILRQLAGLSNNLNQLARRAKADGFASVALLVQHQVQALGKLLDRYQP
jgi:hypothetical protein